MLGFGIAISLATAILFGLAPAWQSTGIDILPHLKEAQSSHSGGRDRAYLRKLLTVAQLALSVCLFFRSGATHANAGSTRSRRLGFEPAQVVAFSIDPTMADYAARQIDRIFDAVMERLRSSPAVAVASYAVVTPLEGGMTSLAVEVTAHIASNSPNRASRREGGSDSAAGR